VKSATETLVAEWKGTTKLSHLGGKKKGAVEVLEETREQDSGNPYAIRNQAECLLALGKDVPMAASSVYTQRHPGAAVGADVKQDCTKGISGGA
jgi:hypothetical protein